MRKKKPKFMYRLLTLNVLSTENGSKGTSTKSR